MVNVREDETVAELLDLKSGLEKSIADLTDEKEKIKMCNNSIMDTKAAERKKRTDEHLKMYRIKMSLVDMQKRIDVQQEHMNRIVETIKMIQEGIVDKMRLKDMEKQVFDLNKAIGGAVSFYSEESLQMELMKRGNAAREKRVEYTKLESEINDMKRRIEEKRLEKERAKLAELEKLRLAEEEAKRSEELKAQAEESRIRDHYRQNLLKPIDSDQSFLAFGTKSVTNESRFLRPKSTNSSTNDTEAANSDQTSEKEVPSSRSSDFSGFTLSQCMRW